jgi:preprotein translocase subunit SecG
MHLLYISKNTIEIFKKYQKVGEVVWTPETLTKNLVQIKSTFSSKFRVILADNFISVSSLLLPPKESKKRSQIQTKFQAVTSEDLSHTVWDYKTVARYNHQNLVQLMYVSHGFFDTFRNAVKVAKIKVELLESFSTTICRFLPAKDLVFINYQDLIVLSFNQTPIYSKVLSKKISQEDINHVFEYTKQRFQTLPQQILFSPIGDVAFNQFDFNNLKPEYTNINPLKGIIHSSNISGSDSQTSRLEISKKIDQPSSSKLSKIMFLLSLLFLIGVFVFIFTHQKSSISSSKSSTPTVTLSPTIAPTPTSKPASAFKIKVLNGTGTAGKASKITKLLSVNNIFWN